MPLTIRTAIRSPIRTAIRSSIRTAIRSPIRTAIRTAIRTPIHSLARASTLSLLIGVTGVAGVGTPGVGVALATAHNATAHSATVAGAGPAVAAADPVGGAQLAQPGVVVNLAPGVPAPPALPFASYVLADMGTGAVLVAKSAHARLLPASTLKALTALTLIPAIEPSTVIVASDADANADGTRVGLIPGIGYPASTLFHGLLMASGNDAAYALAGASGGIPQTLAAMNAQAGHLGAFDTVAKDPSGLDRPGQTSSAYDLVLIGRAAMALPDFRIYVATRQFPFPGGRRADGAVLKGFVVGNHNKLLYNYPGAIGIKNGYTVAARQTYIGAATRGGRTYIAAMMAGSTNSWRPTAALFDWAFANASKVTPVGTLVEPGTVSRPDPASPTPPTAGTSTETSPPAATSGTTSAGTPASAAAAMGTVRSPDRIPQRPWIGVAALVCALALVATLARRTVKRHRG